MNITAHTFRKFLFVLFVTILIPVGCSKKQPQQQIPPARVTAVKAGLQTPDLLYETFGTLVSPESVEIVSQVTGKIAAARFKEGDMVDVGDVLFVIDTDIYQAEVEAARAQLLQGDAHLKLAKITLERNKGLLGKKLISQQDYDSLKAQLEEAQGQRDLAAAQLDQAEINLGYCMITSPTKGKTGKRLVDPGNVVIADQGPTMTTIKGLDRLYIDFSVSEDYFQELSAKLAKGPLEVRITPAGSTEEYTGLLSFLNNTVDPSAASFDMRGEIENKDGKLWPGQYVTVELKYGEVKDALVVSEDAVQVGQKGPYIFTIDSDNKARQHNPVKIGPHIKGGLIIEDGIKEGDLVVTSGQLGLRDGREVTVIKPGQDKDGQQ